MCYVAFLVAVGFSISQVNWVKHIVDTSSGIKSLTQGFMPADIDKDEFADFVAHTNDTVVWYEDDGAWNFTKYVIGPADDGDGDSATPCVYPCDLDKDGDMDVLVATAGLGLGWYKNESLVWSWCPIDTLTPEGYHRVVPADLNGDPYTDLVAVNDSVNGMYGIVYSFINDGSQNFTKYRVDGGNPPSGGHGWRVLTLDSYSDGDDICDVGAGWEALTLWQNDGTGTSFERQSSPPMNPIQLNAGCLLDVNMNGHIEVIVGGKAIDDTGVVSCAFFASQYPPHFHQHLKGTKSPSPAYTCGVTGYDVNSDGLPDIIGVGGRIGWFEQILSDPPADTFTLHDIDSLNGSYWIYADDIGNMCVTDSGAHIIYELSMLRMISPNGGENWAGGSTHNIVWGAPDNVTPTNYFRLSYSTDSGSTYPNEIATDISSDSTSWEWELPIMSCDSCRVKVELFDDTKSLVAEETGNFDFAIKPHVKILDTIVNPGDTVDIAIYLTDVTGLKDATGDGIKACDIVLGFSHHGSGLLKALQAKKGSLLTGSWSISSNPSGNRIEIGLSGAIALTGSGSLAIVPFIVGFTALPGDTSMISFDTLCFNEGKISAHTISGKATVSGVRVNISGDCHYWSNDVAVAGVSMNLSGDHSNNVQTNGSGHYSFPAESGANYTVTPGKKGGGGDTHFVFGSDAVSALDASMVLCHIVEYDTLVDNECVAAEVSGDGTIRAYDASLILQYSVGLIDSFPLGSWVFQPESTSYMPIVSDTTDEDYTAVLYGDVSGNWGAKCLASFAYNGDTISVEIPRMSVAPAETVDVPVQIGDVTSDSIRACEITLTFDSTFATALEASTGSVVPAGWTMLSNPSPGKIKIALATDTVFLHGSGELVVVPFVVDADVQGGDSTKIHFSDFIFNEGIPPAELQDGFLGVPVGTDAIPCRIPKVFFASQNRPNPFIGLTDIEYGLPKNADVKISIYNLSGQKVATLVKGNKKAGYHQVKWDGKDKHGKKVATGIYFYRMEAGDFKATKKLTVLK